MLTLSLVHVDADVAGGSSDSLVLSERYVFPCIGINVLLGKTKIQQVNDLPLTLHSTN